MRPVNLIPKEERSGVRAPLRGGPLVYVVVGALLAALAAVTVLVVTNNQISSSEGEIETLNAEILTAEARAAETTPYAQFGQVTQQRAETIANLANSRFDWEKVMSQLSLVIPADITLTNLTGTVKPGVSVDSAASVGLRESTAGPALQLIGCGPGQESVARFVSALEEIDGVTRVGMQASALPSAGGEGSSASSSAGCQGEKLAQFQIVVAFDAAPIPTTGSSGEVAAAPVEAIPAEEGESAEAGEAGAEGEGG